MVPYSGTRENINLTNGNLNITVPLLNLPGRNHHDLSLNLIYDSKVWKFTGGYEPESNSMGGFWEEDERPAQVSTGWHLNIPYLQYTDGPGPIECSYWRTYIVYLFDGSKTSFQEGMGPCEFNSVTMDSDDNPEMRLNWQLPNAPVLEMPNGVKVYFENNGGYASRIVDANGNEIKIIATVGYQTFSAIITDTLGREIKVDNSGIRYRASATEEAQITFQLASHPVNWNFAVPRSTWRNGDPYTICLNPEGSTTWNVLRSVTLPTGLKYEFTYNSYGELSGIKYPTGGYTGYSYTELPNVPDKLVTRTPIGILKADFREITGKRVCSDWSATFDAGTGVMSCPSGEQVFQYLVESRTIIDPKQNTTIAIFSSGPSQDPYSMSRYWAARDRGKWVYDSSGKLLQHVVINYTDETPYGWSQVSSMETTNDAGQVSRQEYTREPVNVWHLDLPNDAIPFPTPVQVTRYSSNILEQREYGFDGQLIRKTVNTWKPDFRGIASTPRLLNLKTREQIFDGPTNVLQAQTDYEYDLYDVALQPSNAIQHNSAYSSAYLTRGNPTKMRRWDSTRQSFTDTVLRYDDAGNIVKFVEPATGQLAQAVTEVEFNDPAGCQCAYSGCTPISSKGAAYNTLIRNAFGHENKYEWSSCLGLLSKATDPNGQESLIERDKLGRVRHGTLPAGGEVVNDYSDLLIPGLPIWTASRTKKADGEYITTKTEYDGIGRPSYSRLCEDGTVSCAQPITTRIAYDATGLKKSETNPYRSESDATFGVTQYTYDALGRVLTVVRPDASVVTTTYIGAVTKTVDETGKERQAETDALGRLIKVHEPGKGVDFITFDDGSRPGMGTVTISQTGPTRTQYCDPETGACDWVYNTGNLAVSVNGFTRSVDYVSSSTATTIADSLRDQFNAAPTSPVTATSSAGVLTFTSKLTGTASNYPLSSSATTEYPEYFGSPKFTGARSGPTLAGGMNPTNPDRIAYETRYSYDVLGNLKYVEQRGNTSDTTEWRKRWFSYNSLSQLTQAMNPESGQIDYAYDERGNLKKKSDQRGIVISYCYDNLNRLTSKKYADDPNCTNPNVSNAYDMPQGSLTNPYPLGRRTGMTYGTTATQWQHDAAGRVKIERRTINAVTKETEYSYGPNGVVQSLKYPHPIGTQGRLVTFAYDTVGRPLAVSDGSSTYASATDYWPFGSLHTGTLGTDISLLNTYNERLQPVSLSATSGAGTLMSRGYDFHKGTGNNGNLFAITDYLDQFNIPNRPVGSMTYTYDGVNRLISAATTGTDCTSMSGNPAGTKNYGQSFTLDAWGNLTNISVTKCTAFAPNQPANPKNQFTGANRYDLAGNMTEGGLYAYDPENRLIASGGTTFTYDADGSRVMKSSGTSGTIYWAGTGMDALSESYTSGAITSDYIFLGGKRVARIDNPGSSETVHYYISDHLGSATVIASETGAVEHESMYFAFGGDRWGTPGTDLNHYKFTGKERDAETGLDLMGARYFGSSMGRFTSTDPLNVPNLQHLKPEKFNQFILNPQNWNGYSYALNNPINAIDPDGFLTIVIHGTWADKDKWQQSQFLKNVAATFKDKNTILFKWSGGNSDKDRQAAAKALAAYIKDHKFADGEKLNIVAHSHGGNVAFAASGQINHKIDTMVTLGTPIRGDYQPSLGNIGRLLNVYSNNDNIQTHGGCCTTRGMFWGAGEEGPAGRTLSGSNVENIDATNEAGGHSELWKKPDTWEKKVVPELRK